MRTSDLFPLRPTLAGALLAAAVAAPQGALAGVFECPPGSGEFQGTPCEGCR